MEWCCSALVSVWLMIYRILMSVELKKPSNQFGPKKMKFINFGRFLKYFPMHSYSHGWKLGCLHGFSSKIILLLLLFMQHNSLEVLWQKLEASIMEIFLFRPWTGLRSLVADANITRCPTTSEACQIVHFLWNHLGAFSWFFAFLGWHRNLNLSCSSGERRLTWWAVEASVALVLPQLCFRRRNIFQAVAAEMRIHL